MPHVSVVIPVFNSAHLIGAALRSVFAQTYRDFEIIVVDDGSEDERDLAVALSEYAGRIQCLRQPNGGPAKARNAGVALAQGDLVAFLDADDEWLPDKLAMQVEYFRRYPETGLLHTAAVEGAHAGTAAVGPPASLFCDLYHTRFFVKTLTVMMPRAVFQTAGGFDERREVHVEDWDLWLRVAAVHPIGYIDVPLAFHRRGGWMSRQIDRTYEAQLLVMDKTRALRLASCAKACAGPAACDRERLHVLHRDWGLELLESGARTAARRQLRKAIAIEPANLRTARLYVSTFANHRMRERVRSVIGSPVPAAKASQTPSKQRRPISMVHDTAYRRFRRGVVNRLRDVQDRMLRDATDRKRVLFEAASPMSFTIFRPLYETLKTDSRVDVWFTSYGTVWEPEQIYGRYGITERVVRREAAAKVRPDAYVNADFWDMTWVRHRTRRIHLFHGVAGKYHLDAPVNLAPTIAAFDCLMFINVDRRQHYIDAGLVSDDALAAALVGYPKVDCLVDGSLNREHIMRGLNLDPGVPVVLYAPTWSPYSSLNTMGVDLIDGLAAEGLQVIVKLHDRSYDRRERGSGNVDWAGKLSAYEGHPRIRVARESDGSAYMVASDMMVSDHSSIAFEYMLLNRPLVIVHRPELIAQAAISRDKVRRLHEAALLVDDVSQTVRAVRKALAHPAHLAAERQQTAGDLFFRPGGATRRALRLLYQLIELEMPSLDTRGTSATRELMAAG